MNVVPETPITPQRDPSEEADIPSRPPSRWRILLGLGFAAAAAILAVVLYRTRPPGLQSLAAIEFGTHPTAAARQAAEHGGGVWRYTWCWFLGALALASICDVGRRLLVPWRMVAKAALLGAVAASVLALLEALLLTWYPEAWWPERIWITRAAQGMAFARNCILAVALPVAGAVLVATAVRVYHAMRGSHGRSWRLGADVIPRRRDGLRPTLPGTDEHGRQAVPAWPAVSSDGDGRADPAGGNGAQRTPADEDVAQYVHEDLWLPANRKLGGTGICVSGGGIRSACVALGALQALQHKRELQKADYLVSVSGGGYSAGAFQMALTDNPPQPAPAEAAETPPRKPTPVPGRARRALKRARTMSRPIKTHATPEDVFEPGSPEEDHLRRHSSYVADSAKDWIIALASLLRGVLANLGLLAATVTVVGGLLYLFYRYTHVLDVRSLAPIFAQGAQSPSDAPHVPPVQQGVITALVVALGMTVLAFSIGLAAFAAGSGLARRVVKAGQALAALTVALAVFGLVLPMLLWATGRLTWSLGLQERGSLAPGGIGTVLLTYMSAIIGILWRRRERIGMQAGSIRARLSGIATSPGVRGVAGGLVQRVVVGLALLVLASVFLLQLGWTATTAPLWSPAAWIVLVAGLTFFSVVLDQTWLSLHPFYRRRLASAFAVRRVRTHGLLRAKAYNYETELTTLSEYGQKREKFPQVIFAGAANLSGSESTPPGRRAVSYTLSHDWIGGPQTGWVRTSTVDGPAFGHVSRDITVQAAVAISGAAFASAMGAQARTYQTFFALSNARLGTWLPNPGHIAEYLSGARIRDWTVPRLPRLRRLPYLLREIVGAYPDTNPLLFVTDGGHYENLGLLELLRHRCKTIYCIDASGDSPPLATTLARAITLAYEELGVTIELCDPFHLVAGGGQPLEPKEPLSTLSGRLSAAAVLTGKVTYPKRGPCPREEGTLVVAKASLTADMPYEVLSYAQSNPVFPHDGTADQWFNVGQFDAYQAVGWHIGLAAVATMRGQHGSTPQQPSRRRWLRLRGRGGTRWGPVVGG